MIAKRETSVSQKIGSQVWSKTWPPGLTMFAIVVALELAVRSGVIAEYLLPAPSSVLRVFIEDKRELFGAFTDTALSSLAGLILSFIFGFGIAILLSMSAFFRRAFLPYAIFFQTVPVISVAPLLVIWFGFGKPTVIASAFIVSIFPIIASTLLGLQSTDPNLVELFRLYSATRLTTLLKLRIPFAMPVIFSGLRIASGLAVIGAIVGEFIGGGGLGSVVDVARTQQRTDKVFAAVLISSVLGLVMVGMVNFIAWMRLRRWHASVQNFHNS